MTTYVVAVPYAKLSIGATEGNRIAVIAREGDVVPEGVEETQFESLLERGIIAPVDGAIEPHGRGAVPVEFNDAGEPVVQVVDLRATAPTEPTVELPEGDPTVKWTVAQVEAFADQRGVDLSGASNQAERLKLLGFE